MGQMGMESILHFHDIEIDGKPQFVAQILGFEEVGHQLAPAFGRVSGYEGICQRLDDGVFEFIGSFPIVLLFFMQL